MTSAVFYCITLADFQLPLERKTIFRKYGLIFFISCHLYVQNFLSTYNEQWTFVHNCNREEREMDRGEWRDSKGAWWIFPVEFSSVHFATPAYPNDRGTEGREREGKSSCRGLQDEPWGRRTGDREREICRSRGYPAISVKGFGYIPAVRGVSGRAPGDGTVPQLKAIFP